MTSPMRCQPPSLRPTALPPRANSIKATMTARPSSSPHSFELHHCTDNAETENTLDAGLEIRPLIEGDAPTWRDLRLRMLRDHPDVFGSSWEEFEQQSLGEVARRLRERNSPPDNALFGGFMNGALIGSTGLHREEGAKDRHKAVIWG